MGCRCCYYGTATAPVNKGNRPFWGAAYRLSCRSDGVRLLLLKNGQDRLPAKVADDDFVV